jgi:hypothetical protein
MTPTQILSELRTFAKSLQTEQVLLTRQYDELQSAIAVLATPRSLPKSWQRLAVPPLGPKPPISSALSNSPKVRTWSNASRHTLSESMKALWAKRHAEAIQLKEDEAAARIGDRLHAIRGYDRRIA